MTPEEAARISIWRDKSARGDLSVAECREMIDYLRAGRRASAASAAASKAKKAPIDANALLAELE